MFIRKWESVLEKHIEGFFNKKFASDLQLAEIEKYLEREMQLKKKKRDGVFYVPNTYLLYISQEDAARLQPKALAEDLYTSLLRLTILQDCLIDEKLTVEFRTDSGLAKGSCEVKSFYELAPAEPLPEAIEAHTIVLEKPAMPPAAAPLAEHKVAALLITAGPDQDSYLELGEKQMHIGRREGNEFLLTDEKASRLHAYIAFEQYRHVLYDAGSLNGTYVNGEKIAERRLRYGDEIQIGNTMILYEVI